MKDTIQRLNKVREKLVDRVQEWKNVQKSEYYKKFGNASELKSDLNTLDRKIKKLLDEEFTILETLQQEIELAKADNQSHKRVMVLGQNSVIQNSI